MGCSSGGRQGLAACHRPCGPGPFLSLDEPRLGPGAAAMSGIVPFLPLDAVKAAAAVVIAASLRRAGVRTT